MSPALAGGFLTAAPPGKSPTCSLYQLDFDTPPVGGGGGYIPSSWILTGLWLQKWLSVTSKTWFSWHAHSWPQNHLTMRKPKQPREDNPAELAADSKHQSATHEIKPTDPPVPCGAAPADVARPCWASPHYTSEITVVISHEVLGFVGLLQGSRQLEQLPSRTWAWFTPVNQASNYLTQVVLEDMVRRWWGDIAGTSATDRVRSGDLWGSFPQWDCTMNILSWVLKHFPAPPFLKREDRFLQWHFTFQKAAGSVEFPYICGSAPEHSLRPEED